MRTIPINQTPDAGDSAIRYGLTRQNTPKESISTIYHCYRTNPRTSHGPSFPGDHCGSSSVRCPQGASTLILATILASLLASLIPPLPAPCRWGPAQATERNQFSCNHSRPESTLAGARTIAVQPHPSEERSSCPFSFNIVPCRFQAVVSTSQQSDVSAKSRKTITVARPTPADALNHQTSADAAIVGEVKEVP